MNEKYLQDEDVVHFDISSKFGINGEILLPLNLVEDMKEHMHAYDGVVKYPLNTVILNALCVYMDYINCELIPFDEHIKMLLEDEVERDMKQEVVV